MSSDDIQRQIEFMIEQQARLNEQQARFDEKMLELEEKQRQNTEDITRLVGAIMNLTLDVQENSRHMAELIEHGKETGSRIAEIRMETDARLNSLINVIERYFSNGKTS